MHGQRENWAGCLLARAINLQLEVSDKWDGRKKSCFLARWNRTAWAVPGSLLLLGAPGELLPSWFPWGRGDFSPGDKPRVLLGAQEGCAHQSSPGKCQSQISHPLCSLEKLLLALQG